MLTPKPTISHVVLMQNQKKKTLSAKARSRLDYIIFLVAGLTLMFATSSFAQPLGPYSLPLKIKTPSVTLFCNSRSN